MITLENFPVKWLKEISELLNLGKEITPDILTDPDKEIQRQAIWAFAKQYIKKNEKGGKPYFCPNQKEYDFFALLLYLKFIKEGYIFYAGEFCNWLGGNGFNIVFTLIGQGFEDSKALEDFLQPDKNRMNFFMFFNEWLDINRGYFHPRNQYFQNIEEAFSKTFHSLIQKPSNVAVIMRFVLELAGSSTTAKNDEMMKAIWAIFDKHGASYFFDPGRPQGMNYKDNCFNQDSQYHLLAEINYYLEDNPNSNKNAEDIIAELKLSHQPSLASSAWSMFKKHPWETVVGLSTAAAATLYSLT